jgi:hypothetical protein
MSSQEWYSYGAIFFYRRHVQFICDHAVTFRNGQWPRTSSGYTDAPVDGNRRRSRSEGVFVKPALVWTEVETRLAHCDRVRARRIGGRTVAERFGLDGELAIGYYLGEFAMDWLVRREQCPEDVIKRRIDRAVAYAGSGPCRRWEGCIGCCDETVCNRKKRQGMGYEEWLRISRHG